MNLERIASPQLGSDVAYSSATLTYIECVQISSDESTLLILAQYFDDLSPSTQYQTYFLYDVESESYTSLNSLYAPTAGAQPDYEFVGAQLLGGQADWQVVATARVKGSDDQQLVVVESDSVAESNILLNEFGIDGFVDIENFKLSEDGRFAALQTSSTLLAADDEPDTNDSSDIYLLDRLSGEITRVSYVANAEVQSNTLLADLSIEGGQLRILFVTDAAYVSSGIDQNSGAVSSQEGSKTDAYLWTTDYTDSGLTPASGAFTLVSKDTDGLASGFVEFDPESSSSQLGLTDTGVIFTSSSGELVVDDSNGASDVFLFDDSENISRLSLIAGGEIDAGAVLEAFDSSGGTLYLSSEDFLVGGAEGIPTLFGLDVDSGELIDIDTDVAGDSPIPTAVAVSDDNSLFVASLYDPNALTVDKMTLAGYSEAPTVAEITFDADVVNNVDKATTAYSIAGLDADATAVLTFTDQNDLTVTVSDVSANGADSVDLSSLADGLITATMAIEDSVGNTATGASDTITLDTSADLGTGASVAITEAYINDAGKAAVEYVAADLDADADAVVTFSSAGGGSPIEVAITDNGTFSVDLSSLSDGAVTAEMAITDAAGNTADGTGDTAQKDTVAPVITIAAIADGYINASDDDSALTISGTTTGVEDNQTLTLSVGGVDYTATVTSNAWSVSVPAVDLQALPEGDVAVTADVGDVAGNAATQATSSFEYDIDADASDDVAVAITATSLNADSAVDAVEYSVSGLDADATAVVTFTSTGGGTAVTANVEADGTATVDLSGLNDGTVTASIAVTDDAGNTATGIPDVVTLDTTSVAEPSLVGRVYQWSSRTLLSDFDVSIKVSDNSTRLTSVTNELGEFSFDTELGVDEVLVPSASLTADETGRVVSASDALAALKLAVGLNPNSNGTDATPYQYYAADVNQDGKVTASDALSILKMAVNLNGAPQREWIFVNESTDFWDETANGGAGAYTVGRTSVDWSQVEASARTLNGAQELNQVAVLKGDVNGSWDSSKLGAQQLQDSYFTDLSNSGVGPAEQWWVL